MLSTTMPSGTEMKYICFVISILYKFLLEFIPQSTDLKKYIITINTR